MKRLVAILLVAVMMIPVVAWAKDVVIRDETTGQEMIYNTETGKVYPKSGARPQNPSGSLPREEMKAEKGVPGLPYSEIPGDDPQEMRAIIGPGHIVCSFNRDLDGAVRLKVEPVPGKSGASKVEMVDAEGNVVKAKGLVRVYAKVPANAVRPIVMRMDGKTVHFAEVEGTGYIWFTAVL